MLVEGSEAPDCFVPTGLHSVEPKKLVTAGKNLINTNGASVLPGTFGVRLPNVTLQPGTYVVKRPSGLMGNFVIYREGDTSASVSAISEAGTSFTLTSPIHGLDFRSSDAGQITLDNISQFQLELGSTATAYEPPNVTTTPLPEVELRSLPNGTCDELVIGADGTCRVERNVLVVTMDGSEDEAWVYNGNSKEASIVIPGGYGELYSGISTDIWSDRFPSTGTTRDKYGCAVTVSGTSSSIAMTLYVGNPGVFTNNDTVKSFFQSNPTTFIVRAKPTTEPQSPVTLPTLPALTFNQYHDADVPSDTSVEYARDINIVIDNLAKQVAGTAATVAINEATR